MTKNNNPINFQIKAVKTIEFCFTPPDRTIKKGERFTFKLKTEFLVNIEKNVVAIRLTVEMFDKKRAKLIASIKTENYFEIKDLKQFIQKDHSDSIKLPDLLLSALINISIGTARGILITKVGGTVLDQMVLPIIQTNALIPLKPIKFKEELIKK
ncbi:MAG: hypothetical protein GWP19_12120 [Planctomycetia bacterium]|nr:hypothetical protein [Planctomycetia bacterium]